MKMELFERNTKEKDWKIKIFQSRDLCLRALDTNSACAKACAEMRRKMVKACDFMAVKGFFYRRRKTEIKAGIKAGLEGLAGQIPGLLSFRYIQKGFLLPMRI